MPPPPLPPQRPKAPSRPELPSASVDAVVGSARGQERVELPSAEQVQRKQTLTGMAPVQPGREALPPLPATKPAPPRNRLQETWRVPTPPSALAQARRSDPPGDDGEPVTAVESPQALRKLSPLPAPSVRPEDARAEALRRENERLRRERDEARARATQVSEAPASVKADAISDDAVGKLVKSVVDLLLKRVGGPVALLACIGGGGGLLYKANEKPAPPPLTAAELDDRLGKFETKVVGRMDTLTTTVNGVIDLQRCGRKKVQQIGGSLLPAPDHMGSALKPQPFEDDCPDSPKRLPEPQR